MSWRQRWVVLVPGKADWVEKRTREILEEVGDGSEIHFTVIPGQGHYQAVVEQGYHDRSPELLLAGYFSLDCEEPVYAIDRTLDFPFISRFLKGKEEDVENQEPEDLVRSLGCVMPWGEEPEKPYKKPTRTAALIQGLSATRVRNALEKDEELPLPPSAYRMTETPQGLLLEEVSGALGYALDRLAYRFPLATVYSVIAKPNLDFFVVFVKRNRKTVQFVPPPKEATYYPAIHEVMGERTPERILAAMGIPKEWFRL